jgi:hypothetical protein
VNKIKRRVYVLLMNYLTLKARIAKHATRIILCLLCILVFLVYSHLKKEPNMPDPLSVGQTSSSVFHAPVLGSLMRSLNVAGPWNITQKLSQYTQAFISKNPILAQNIQSFISKNSMFSKDIQTLVSGNSILSQDNMASISENQTPFRDIKALVSRNPARRTYSVNSRRNTQMPTAYIINPLNKTPMLITDIIGSLNISQMRYPYDKYSQNIIPMYLANTRQMQSQDYSFQPLVPLSRMPSTDISYRNVPPTITMTSLPMGVIDIGYVCILKATGTTPITWSITSGILPPTLRLVSNFGVIMGTPKTEGTYFFTVKAKNDAGSITKDMRIIINPIMVFAPSPESAKSVAQEDSAEEEEEDEEENDSDEGGCGSNRYIAFVLLGSVSLQLVPVLRSFYRCKLRIGNIITDLWC